MWCAQVCDTWCCVTLRLACWRAEAEIARTQKNKATNSHLMRLKARLSKLRTQVSLGLRLRNTPACVAVVV